MGHAVPRQRCEVVRVQKRAIANLHAIAPAPGQLPEELVQLFDELPPLLQIGGEVRELHLVAVRFYALELPAGRGTPLLNWSRAGSARHSSHTTGYRCLSSPMWIAIPWGRQCGGSAVEARRMAGEGASHGARGGRAPLE